jgi:signal transduction histidine kinase/DNA-binding response OmpR family regulator
VKKKFRAHTKLFITVISVLSIGLVLLIAANAYRNLVAMSANNSELYSAYRISELMKSFRTNLSVLENKKKGYLITGDAKFMEEYLVRESETKTFLKSMETYFSGKPEEPAFNKLKSLTYNKLIQNKSLSGASDVSGFATGRSDGGASVKGDPIAETILEISGQLDLRTSTLINNNKDFLSDFRKWLLLEVLFIVLVVISGLILVFRDINIRVKLETELRRAKKEADDNALVKEQFLANMSHEIRTPLNSIIGFGDLLAKTRMDEAQEGYLNAIRKSGSNLLNIINDILDFSRLEAGKVAIEKIPFSVHETVESVRTIFSGKAAEKGLLLTVNVHDDIPGLLFGDPMRLTQILTNLVGNALKFTHQGKVEVACSLVELKNENAALAFTVTDTGIGITPEKLPHIFERFNQGNPETTRQYGGTGLGLAIVQNLAELQNGKISVKSRPGEGSVFTLNISYPLSFETPAVPQQTNAISGISSSWQPRILLTEDNELNQKLATKYLESFGFHVELAVNGKQAVEMAKQNKYDLVLMDIQMPVMDGYSATRLIRETVTAKMPVIAMTARAIAGEKERCIESGMNDYILKPFREEELRYITHKFIQAAQAEEFSGKPSGENKNTIVDMEDLISISRGNRDFMAEMMEMFIERNPADILEMEQYLKSGDYNGVNNLAHKMKTSVGFMGLKKLLPLLSLIEQLSGKRDKNVQSAFNELRLSCEKAVIEFKAQLPAFQIKP